MSAFGQAPSNFGDLYLDKYYQRGSQPTTTLSDDKDATGSRGHRPFPTNTE
jgi:hypothetical protein